MKELVCVVEFCEGVSLSERRFLFMRYFDALIKTLESDSAEWNLYTNSKDVYSVVKNGSILAIYFLSHESHTSFLVRV